MKTSSTWSPIVMPSMIGRNSSRPNIWMARLSVPENLCRLPTASRTCWIAAFSIEGETALNTRTLE